MRAIKILVVMLLIATTSCSGQNGSAEQKSKSIEQTSKNNKTMGTIHLTKEEFLKKVVNYEANDKEWKYLGDKPCIIDFYADWCGPCKAVAPVLEELSKTYDGQIYIYKINTDQEQEVAGAFGIRSIPSILFVPMEGKPQMSVGALGKSQLVDAIDKVLLEKK
jgi:thioredoxin